MITMEVAAEAAAAAVNRQLQPSIHPFLICYSLMISFLVFQRGMLEPPL